MHLTRQRPSHPAPDVSVTIAKRPSVGCGTGIHIVLIYGSAGNFRIFLLLMVRRRESAVSNHEAPISPAAILRDARQGRAPQDEGRGWGPSSLRGAKRTKQFMTPHVDGRIASLRSQ